MFFMIWLVNDHKLKARQVCEMCGNPESSSGKIEKYSFCMVWWRDGKFTFGDTVKATDDINENYCIGKGGFGRVYKAELTTTLPSCSEKA